MSTRLLRGNAWFIGIALFLALMAILSTRELSNPFPRWSDDKLLIFGEIFCIWFCAQLAWLSKEKQERTVFIICGSQFFIALLAQFLQPSLHAITFLREIRLLLWATALLLSLARHPSTRYSS